ncbi:MULTISPECIES: CoA transferase [unclassified Dietzia]|uniref:CoA transferase n=1 Tax=unclassified Dietzia TaxID=2617939 RepID=UPI0015F903DE|nr:MULTISPECIES: CoA transferase [unclassified Dietzia]MBB1025646.1 2-methylfumaryl-CoA isomerase [Dietzia sp. DQ12-76]MBB1027964.1 2-methylfumaryl-CoA isomerase [Dietzia sp. DQ11-38-2]
MTDLGEPRPLSGMRVIELSSFVASPLCGLTLSQLGAEVIRVDPVGGAADVHRWPVAPDGTSIYWTGLNRGKSSVTLDLRSDRGRQALRDLVTAPGEGGGILVTNSGGRDWMSHDRLASARPDVITLELLGRRDGGPAVDYTVNAGLGFPAITGPTGGQGGEQNGGPVVNHVLPAWDVAAGLHAALAVVAAVRDRERTGRGRRIVLPLDDVALATAGTLGYLTEPQIDGSSRPAVGNYVYGTFGRDFPTADGGRVMVVALTTRHFHDLARVTGTRDAVDALESATGADFDTEADRYSYREVLSALFARWFAAHTTDEVTRALAASSVLHERYRTFDQVVAEGDLEANPLFAPLEQPGLGSYLAAAHPATFDGRHMTAGPAPTLGADTDRLTAEGH